MSKGTKPKVVVVGGGCAGLTAAYELSKNPALDVTVYQLGWRLGGKAASGRNAAKSGRIEEHGLHVWFGAYENTFRLARHCYDFLNQLKADSTPIVSRFTHIEDAVIAENTVGIVNRFDNGDWRTWLAHLPPTPGLPGDPLSGTDNPFTLRRYLSQSLQLLRSLVTSMVMPAETEDLVRNDRRRERSHAQESDKLNLADFTISLRVEKMFELLRKGALSSASVLLEAMTLVDLASDVRFGLPGDQYLFIEFVRAVADNTRKLLETAISTDPAFRLKLDIVELVMATVVGIVREGLLTNEQGLDAIDGVDCREWLARNGCSEHARNSGFVRALYGMVFADTPGSSDKSGLAAGQALRGAFRMFFTYRGALFWKLRGSTSDVLFAPLYEALKRRGVKFKFFHRLVDVVVDDNRVVTQLQFERQASVTTRAGVEPDEQARVRAPLRAFDLDEYYPLDSEGSWPSQPLPDQVGATTLQDPTLELQQGSSIGKNVVLKCGADFDYVVLSVSVDVIKKTCGRLIDKNARWRRMAKASATIATQAVQVWLDKGLEELGWKHGPAIVSGIPGPFDTWADMTHIVANEHWRGAKPKSLAYFCAALPAEDEGATTENLLKQRLQVFFRDQAPRLWGDSPGAVPSGDRFYARVNVDASDRYVLSPPGSVRHRISPLDDSFVNLTVAGDWTSCGINQGCIEAAVISGLLASHALTQTPVLSTIIGYDHP